MFSLLTGSSWRPALPGPSVVSPSFHVGIPILSSSLNSLKIPIRFLPLGLLSAILPSITSFNKPLPRTMYHIHLFLSLVILFSSSLFSSTSINTSSFVFRCTQPTSFILVQIHISNSSILLISSVSSDHVSNPYKRTLQTMVWLFLPLLLLLQGRIQKKY